MYPLQEAYCVLKSPKLSSPLSNLGFSLCSFLRSLVTESLHGLTTTLPVSVSLYLNFRKVNQDDNLIICVFFVLTMIPFSANFSFRTSKQYCKYSLLSCIQVGIIHIPTVFMYVKLLLYKMVYVIRETHRQDL